MSDQDNYVIYCENLMKEVVKQHLDQGIPLRKVEDNYVLYCERLRQEVINGLP